MIHRDFSGDFAPQSNYSEMNPSPNTEETLEVFGICDIVDPVINSQQVIFDLTTKVYGMSRISFEGYERKMVSFNHFELLEFYYSIVRETLIQIQSPQIKSVQELGELSIHTLPLFLEPVDVTEEELEWSKGLFGNGSENLVELELPSNSIMNYAINVKRISNDNKFNPDFNTSILELFNPSPIN